MPIKRTNITPILRNDRAFVTAAKPKRQPTKNAKRFPRWREAGRKHIPTTVKKAPITSPYPKREKLKSSGKATICARTNEAGVRKYLLHRKTTAPTKPRK